MAQETRMGEGVVVIFKEVPDFSSNTRLGR